MFGALAANQEPLTAWTAGDVAHRIVRIDFQVSLVRPGDLSTGRHAKDVEVRSIYAPRTEVLADRKCTRTQ